MEEIKKLKIAVKKERDISVRGFTVPAFANKGMLVFAAGLIIAILIQSMARLYTLHSNVFDLGIFDSLLFSMADAGQWQLAFTSHAHWFALLFEQIYKIPVTGLAPYALVLVQAVLLVSPILWFYRTYGALIALCYAGYYPLWANALFDFHFDHLAVPLLFGFYWGLLRRKPGVAVLCASLLMLVKEPFALQSMACGLLMIAILFQRKEFGYQTEEKSSQYKLAAGGIWLVLAGGLYFYFSTSVLIPYFTVDEWPGVIGGSGFEWLGGDIAGVMKSVIGKPHVIVWSVLTNPLKLQYLFVIFGLLAFIPLLRPTLLLPALPMLGISMLSQVRNYYDYNTHYSAGLIIPVFFAFIYGLPRAAGYFQSILRWLRLQTDHHGGRATSLMTVESFYKKEDRSRGSEIESMHKRVFFFLVLGWVLAGHAMLSPSPVSRLFWSEKVWSFRLDAYVPHERTTMIREAITRLIPREADVVVSVQNNLNWGPLAHRRVYSAFPAGVSDPIQKVDLSNRTLKNLWEYIQTGNKPRAAPGEYYADYVVLDLKRPLFLVDRGCDWVYGQCKNDKVVAEFNDRVAYTRLHYETIYDQDGFMIFGKK
ncbi:MAG: DUF2079 domain-containing protein [Pseudomonadales bacterium]|nr:DUF2079 domain-containing protein [Pseudomonadales bacterium]